MLLKTTKHIITYTLCLMLAVCRSGYGQSLTLDAEYYSLNEGLSDRTVTDILQSRFGFIWIATANGLNKFDGYDFTIYNNYANTEKKNRISSSNIEEIAETKTGEILILYKNNILFFDLLDPRTNELTKIRLTLEKGIKGIVRDVNVNRKGEIQVLTTNQDGTFIFQYVGDGLFEELFFYPESHQQRLFSISFIQLQSGPFFINDSEKGLRLFGLDGELVKAFESSDFEGRDGTVVYPGQANFLHEDVGGRVWFALYNSPGVFLYDPGARGFERPPSVPETELIFKMWEDSKGNVLLAQTPALTINPPVSKLYCVTLGGDTFDFSHLLGIGNLIIAAHSEDFFKTIFFGVDTGLKIVQNNRSKVTTFLAKNVGSDRRGAVIRGIEGDGKGRIFFAREVDHWYILHTKYDNIDTINLRNDETGEILDFSCSLDIEYDHSRNELWGISCMDSRYGQLHRYQLDSCTTTTYQYDYKINAFIRDKSGVFWLGCQIGAQEGQLVTFDPETEQFETYSTKEGENPLKEAIPHFMLEGKDGKLWVGTESGLYRLDRKRDEVEVFKVDNEDKDKSLSDNTVYVIHEDEKGKIWMGTKNGLNRLDPLTGKVDVYDKSDGLASNTVCGILPGGQGNFWISTYNGLSYFNPELKTFKTFYQLDGFSNDEFNRFSYYQDEKGRLYFGGVNGLNAFYPEDLLILENNPPVVLTKFTRFDSKTDSLIVQETGLHDLKEITISPYDTYFQFHFALPNYTRPQRNQFKAWLEGYENQSTYLGNTPTLRYNSLPPGNYTLHLQGADPNGNWSQELSIDIHVDQIFYKTWWFFLIVVAVIGLILYLLFQYQLDQRLRVERFRTKLSSDLHDEVSGLLSGIAMQTDVLQMMAKDKESKSRLKTIGEVSRKAMSKMNDVIWSIDSRKDKVEDLISRMREHADDILLPMNIRYEFKLGKLDRTHRMTVTNRQNLYFIYKEAINNIAKHSNASEVEIRMGNEGPYFELLIRDNGSGNGKHSSKSGMGLSNIKMRAQRIKANLDIQTEKGYHIFLKMKRFT